MNGGTILESVEIVLRDTQSQHTQTLWLDIFNNSLSRKWLDSLNELLIHNYHLEKNYCFLGFAHSTRSGKYILDRVNQSIQAINQSRLGYEINDFFSLENSLEPDEYDENGPGGLPQREKLNNLHRYFEDLQGTSGSISKFFQAADARTRWHIRQLNLLCHEFESWALSFRKIHTAPEWQRPSQLMCWLQAPRFALEPQDFELFGIETINRPMGGVFVGVNKAVGKHHWEVFNDEGRDSRISELTTTVLAAQTEAAGDFDIEWGVDPAGRSWQIKRLAEFRQWLTVNGFDPADPTLAIGHPQIGQVDLLRSFGTTEPSEIWKILNNHLDVASVSTSRCSAHYPYHWSDHDYIDQQIAILGGIK